MLQNNPEIEHIVNAATEYAIELHHKYVTVEHIAYALLKFEKFNNLLYKLDVDVEALISEFEDYLETGLNSIISRDFTTMAEPSKFDVYSRGATSRWQRNGRSNPMREARATK